MSKTDKTDPYWVQAYRHPRRVIRHGYDCEFSNRRFGSRGKPCDIDYGKTDRPRASVHIVGDRTVYRSVPGWYCIKTVEEVEHYDYWRVAWVTPGCDYVLPDQSPYYFQDSPPRDFIKDTWYAPSRTEERIRLRDAVKDYNANGDTEHVELDHQQHRHGAGWRYW